MQHVLGVSLCSLYFLYFKADLTPQQASTFRHTHLHDHLCWHSSSFSFARAVRDIFVTKCSRHRSFRVSDILRYTGTTDHLEYLGRLRSVIGTVDQNISQRAVLCFPDL